MARLRPLLLAAFVVLAGACDEDWGEPQSTLGLPPAHDQDTTSPDAGGKLKAADQGCNADTDCETNLCFKGNGQNFCTTLCTIANQLTVCVPPYTGTCNKQGYCKRD
jgi:hypothetical protein